MKKIVTLLLILVCLQSNAQDPQLFENTWYLQNLIIDGQNNISPVNEELPYVTANFYESGAFFDFASVVCNVIYGSIDFDAVNPTFYFTEGYIEFGIISCEESINLAYETLYVSHWFSIETAVLTYLITNNGNDKTLTISNSFNNDYTVYSNTSLANQGFNKGSFLIYPSPTKGLLSIKSPVIINKVQVYNVLGALVLEKYGNVRQLDVSKLANGVLFMKVTTAQGIVTKQFIKN